MAWGTSPGATTTLEWGPDASYGTAVTPTAQRIDALGMDLWHVRVTGLPAGTPACYRVTVGGEIVASGLRWRTAPDGPAPIRVLAMGDFGNGSPAQAAVRDRALALHAEQPIDLWLTTGDNAYGDGTHAQFQDNVFDVYRALWHAIPVLPTPGNHDWGEDESGVDTLRPYLEDFFLPEHGIGADHPENYYSVDYGALHWTALDSHFEVGPDAFTGSPITRLTEAPGDDMLDWATDDVANAGDRWKIAGWHHPAYSGQIDRTPEIHVLLSLLPWVEANPVDIVLNGHNHMYERFSNLRDGAKVEEGGTTWVVTGGGGASMYDIGPHELKDAGEEAHHLLLLEIDRCTLTGISIADDGREIDRFEQDRCTAP